MRLNESTDAEIDEIDKFIARSNLTRSRRSSTEPTETARDRTRGHRTSSRSGKPSHRSTSGRVNCGRHPLRARARWTAYALRSKCRVAISLKILNRCPESTVWRSAHAAEFRQNRENQNRLGVLHRSKDRIHRTVYCRKTARQARRPTFSTIQGHQYYPRTSILPPSPFSFSVCSAFH